MGSTRILDSPLNDEALLTRIVQGDAAALEILFDRHAPMILGIALRITGNQTRAEKIVQETFWQVWRSADAYQPGSVSVDGWLFRMARELALDAERSERRQKVNSGKQIPPPEEPNIQRKE